MKVDSMNAIGGMNHTYTKTIRRVNKENHLSQNEINTLISEKTKDTFKPVDIKAINASCYRQYLMNNVGETVFDLSKLEEKMENQPAFPEVKQFTDDLGRTRFRCYLVKPNSDRLITVDVALLNYDGDQKMDEQTFMNTIGKAILVLDRHITMSKNLGDTVPDHIAPEFTFDKTLNRIDLSSLLKETKNDFMARTSRNFKSMNLFWNKLPDKKMIEEYYKDLEEFILEIIQKDLNI